MDGDVILLLNIKLVFQDWMVKYDQDTPVQPRYDLNAPDLYIPSMGYVTYVLLAGFMLGERFFVMHFSKNVISYCCFLTAGTLEVATSR